jgi:hypothetical protein
MSISKQANVAIHYSNIDTTKFEFTTPEENQRSKNQLIGWVRYGKGGQLLIKSDFCHLSSGGVPRESEYHPTDDKRRHMRVPENDTSKGLFDKLREIDEILGSDQTRERFFGKKANKYTYVPIVRDPIVDEDDENAEVKPSYIKLVFCTSYPDGNITTNIFWNKEDGNPPEKQDVLTPDDAMKAVPYLSTNRYVISPVKIWAQQPKMKDPTYGITFKIVQIETKHGESGCGLNQYLGSNTFIVDSDEVPTTKETNSNDKETNQETVFTNQEEKDSESESESSDDSSDSEDEEPEPVKKSGRKKKN